MGKISIENLFTEKRGTQPTRAWANLLRANKDRYANCRVISFTRVKNLNSSWKHEYVQFIVEEEETKERARIYAERGNEIDLDWVTFGPAETSASGSKGADDLPLPLTSLIFDDKQQSKRPTVLEIAEILSAATTIGGPYQLFGHSCFWFAYTTYDAVRLSFGKQATEKKWHWFNVGGVGGGGGKDAIGLGWTTLFKFYYVSDAKAFKKEREGNMTFLDGEKREVVDPSYFIDRLSAALSVDENRAIYLEAMRDQGIDITDSEVENVLDSSRKGAGQEANGLTNWTGEFDMANESTVRRVLSQPDAAQLQLVYDSLATQVQTREQPLADAPLAEGMERTLQQTALALRIVVAKILEEAALTETN